MKENNLTMQLIYCLQASIIFVELIFVLLQNCNYQVIGSVALPIVPYYIYLDENISSVHRLYLNL